MKGKRTATAKDIEGLSKLRSAGGKNANLARTLEKKIKLTTDQQITLFEISRQKAQQQQ